MTTGQHSHPDGLFFGGRDRAWSNHLVEEILRGPGWNHRSIAIVDLHTGLGKFGCRQIISVTQPEIARTVFGSDVVSLSDGKSLASSTIQGMLLSAAAGWVQPTRAVAVAVEIGTVPFDAMLEALRFDNWVHERDSGNAQSVELARQAMRAAFCPNSNAWRDAAVACGREIIESLQRMGRETHPM